MLQPLTLHQASGSQPDQNRSLDIDRKSVVIVGYPYPHILITLIHLTLKECRCKTDRPHSTQALDTDGLAPVHDEIHIIYILIYSEGHRIFYPLLQIVPIDVAGEIEERRQVKGTFSQRHDLTALPLLGRIKVGIYMRVVIGPVVQVQVGCMV